MKVGLFIPCYVDALFPQTGISTYKLLRHYGIDVEYPERQTCCGQPQGNAGFEEMSVPLARTFEDIFSGYDYVVGPSASCAAYVVKFYPRLLKGHHSCLTPGKTTDIITFLHDVLKVKTVPGRFPHIVSVHNSCHGVRELGLSTPSEINAPRMNKIVDLLKLVDGIDVREPERPDECCGFGGMFAVEEPDTSRCMGEDKLRRHIATGAEFITGADSSCLMHMQGIARRERLPIKFIHAVDILANGL